MFKVLALSALAVLIPCGSASHSHKEATEAAAWPQLNLYTTFQADSALFTWDGHKLSTYKDITATLKVDSGRNKIKINAKVGVPLIGKVNAEVLVDLTKGVAYESVPFLRICQQTNLNMTLNLKDTLEKIYSPIGGITQYDGEKTAPWDNTKMYEFHAGNVNGTATAWFDEGTHNGKWIYEQSKDSSIPQLVVQLPTGERQATFQDSDFVLSGCKTFNAEPEQRVSIWFDEAPQ